MKIIHFVCTANTYRSRLAETYFNSKEVPGMKAVSSGIHASNNASGPICWYAERILKNNNLIFFMSKDWTLTTAELLNTSDINIFMDASHYAFCRDYLGYKKDNYVIWDTPDFECHYHTDPKASLEEDISHLEESEHTFMIIKEHVDMLIERLKVTPS